MGLTKSEYILKQLNKSKNKIYEAYVTHRLFNALKSNDLRFSCQHYVKFEDGNYALLDMYFPDLNIQVEIDEGHHNNKKNIISDEERQELVKQTIDGLNSLERNGILTLKSDLEIFRVEIYDESSLKSIEQIDKDIDDVIEKIKNIINDVKPSLWNFEEEFSYKKYVNKKTITVSDNIQLKYISDVINLFGGKKDGNHFTDGEQARGFGKLSHINVQDINYWCPQKSHKNWDNRLSDDGLRIHEKRFEEHGKQEIKRATFFKAKDNLGIEFYRFVGVFGFLKLDGDYNVYEKISDRIEVLPVQDN
ncbi:hypothetical protein N8782_00485 [Methylophilaceae bacterium]|nr:hypothetical protein [Methylophilaceae bacterium]|tara:strand:- start:210 stop:1124 length:915 start_codon:yes stop_codon:yes gene_type:complete